MIIPKSQLASFDAVDENITAHFNVVCRQKQLLFQTQRSQKSITHLRSDLLYEKIDDLCFLPVFFHCNTAIV